MDSEKSFRNSVLSKTTRELLDLAAEAQRWFESLTPEEQEAHRKEQRRSFAYGNVALSHPEGEYMTREEFDQLMDKLDNEAK